MAQYNLDAAHGVIRVEVDMERFTRAIEETTNMWNELVLDTMRFTMAMYNMFPTRQRAIYNVINMPWVKENWHALAGSKTKGQKRRLQSRIDAYEHIIWAHKLKSEGTVRNNG